MAELITARVALAAAAVLILAHTPSSAEAPYCTDLRQIATVALKEGQFASIAGEATEGSFSKTNLSLTGWQDCALYGANTYTCDSEPVRSVQDAEKRQAAIIDEILSCFAGSWLHILHRSSPGYAVLHPAKGAASITLSLDEIGDEKFVVRLSLFVRRG